MTRSFKLLVFGQSAPEAILDGDDPQQNATRAEALEMLKNAFGTFPEPKGHNLRSGYPAENFTDIPEDLKSEISDVLASGIIAGTSSDTLSPDTPITKEQLELLIDRTYSYFGTNLKDDYWSTVNKTGLDSLEVPQGDVSTGGAFNIIGDKVDEQLKAIMDELLSGNYKKGTKEQKIADLYRSAMNTENRKKTGLTPIMPYIELIDNTKDIGDITEVCNTLDKELVMPTILSFSVSSNPEDSSKNMMRLYFTVGFLESPEYYDDQDTVMEYKKFVETLFKAAGESEEKAAKNAELVIGYEKRIMQYLPTYQEVLDVDKKNNYYSFEELREMFPTVDMDSVFAASGFDESWKNTDISITSPEYAKAIAAEFTEDNVDTIKAYTKFMLLKGFGPVLSDDLADVYYGFYEAMGMGGGATPEEDALGAVVDKFPDYLGEIYIEKYFSPEKKQNVEAMVQDIIGTYKKNLENVDWMSEQTKEKAILKLDNIKVIVGYPDEFPDIYKDVDINSESIFENDIALALADREAALKGQFESFNENDADILVFEVDAGYAQELNAIILPAGILQAPFYDYDADYETNLGGIGHVIAHEVSHAFDNSGSKYDENGNGVNWWTDEDRAAFDALCDKMIKYYDGAEAAPGITTDGALTIGENIADNGGMSCILEIASGLDDPDYDELFRSAARCWAESYTRDYLEYLQLVDPHSNAKLRINKVLSNCQQFYDTYDIKEGDGMYVAPEDRVKIW